MQSSKEYQGKIKPSAVINGGKKLKKKKLEENNRMERLEISSRKLEIPGETFMQRWTQ